MPVEKRIKSDQDLHHFHHTSPGYKLILSYLEKLCLAVKGKLTIPQTSLSPSLTSIVSLVEQIEVLINSIEPIHQPMRFGNKAYRTFHEQLTETAATLMVESGIPEESIEELIPYLLDSFGNPVRIDYGTGHELAFLGFIIILAETKFVEVCDELVLIVFRKYFSLVRLVTSKYCMEPAGSHGVWGLDDYHHLPFLLGAAQLIGHEADVCQPRGILGKTEEGGLFGDGVGYVKSTKCKFAPFHEVAPMLYDLTSRMDNWSLVCYGLMQMYKSEVLGKRPIMQHFFFGNVIKWE